MFRLSGQGGEWFLTKGLVQKTPGPKLGRAPQEIPASTKKGGICHPFSDKAKYTKNLTL